MPAQRVRLSLASLGAVAPPNPGVGWVGPERPAETWADVKADPLSAMFDFGRGLVLGNAPVGRNLQGVGALLGAALPLSKGLKAMSADREGLQGIVSKWEAAGVKLDAYETPNGTIAIGKIVVPPTERGKGIGTAAMRELADYADATGKTVTLSPSVDFGATSLDRLKTFYKRLGFVENKGRSRDFSLSDSMYREPRRAK